MYRSATTSTKSIPVTILTGFLGSGKTSFLARMLAQNNMSRTAIIINEFGEYSLDHMLVDHITGQTFELPGGCLCCSAQGKLVEKMLDLIAQNKSNLINRLIIETSGMADAENLVAALWNNPQIRSAYRLAKIITVVSATEWENAYANNNEFVKQLALSDAIVVSKSDLLDKFSKQQTLGHLLSVVKAVTSNAEIIMLPASNDQLSDLVNRETKILGAMPSTNNSHNTTAYQTFSLTHSKPVSRNSINQFMEIVLHRFSKNLLRIKGLVQTIESPGKPMVVQSVGSTNSPVTWLDKWEMAPTTQLTVIHTGNIRDQITGLFKGMQNIPGLDQPDNAALTDNPLSVSGIGNFDPTKY